MCGLLQLWVRAGTIVFIELLAVICECCEKGGGLTGPEIEQSENHTGEMTVIISYSPKRRGGGSNISRGTTV